MQLLCFIKVQSQYLAAMPVSRTRIPRKECLQLFYSKESLLEYQQFLHFSRSPEQARWLKQIFSESTHCVQQKRPLTLSKRW